MLMVVFMSGLAFADPSQEQVQGQSQTQIQGGGIQVQVQTQGPGPQQSLPQAQQQFYIQQVISGQNSTPANTQVQTQTQSPQ